MVEQLDDMPEGTIGFRISGTLVRDDYDAILPPLRAAIDLGDPLRVLLEIASVDATRASALWEQVKADATLRLGHPRSWERLALASDVGWVRQAIGLFGWMVPADIRLFRLAEGPEAIAWLARA